MPTKALEAKKKAVPESASEQVRCKAQEAAARERPSWPVVRTTEQARHVAGAQACGGQAPGAQGTVQGKVSTFICSSAGALLAKVAVGVLGSPPLAVWRSVYTG